MQEKSSIDLLSNRTILRGYSRHREIFLARLGTYPPETLPQFLHELTHQWCFNSPVGIALALLHLEAAAIDWSKDTAPSARQRARDCLLKAMVALTLLRPVVEGMALFAEFDLMVTSYGELCSKPVLNIATLFRDPSVHIQFGRGSLTANASEHNKWSCSNFLANPFYALRTSPHLIDRKSSLLSSPFSMDGDAYLLGYLLMKSMWVSSFSRFPRLLDPDLFQMLFRSFLFSDSSLVVRLLDPSPCTNESFRQLALHIEGRLLEYLRVPIQQLATQYEEKNKGEPIARVGLMHEIQRAPWEAPALVQDAAHAVSRSLERLARLAFDDSSQKFLALSQSLIDQREAMTILAVDASFQHNTKGMMVITCNGLPVHVMDHKLRNLPDKGQGRFSIHLLPNSARQICLFELHESRELLVDVLLSPPEDGQSEERERNLQAIAQGLSSRAIALELCENAVERVKINCGVDWERTENALRQAAAKTYIPMALLFATDRDEVHTKMRAGGFWTLLGGDTTAVEYLARLSCWSSCLAGDPLVELCRLHGFELNEANDLLINYCASVGFRFFTVGDKGRPLCIA
ncbi:hypothetical protein NLM27_26685 [Bradyrhizobium sp. CCGB12]|uniref:hypothetical protein n=1 Tax=Bradyrhizobium sp. CCGB12 TaxID=2949632 RepID=UPI0020B2C1D7|nr:hypothetical protein [Bradyrhizobium sp. CCGB12]MCP3392340.1 hypothetical protein [Bradyrhizobium sp. CCGB12]